MKNLFVVLTLGLLVGYLGTPAFGGQYSLDFDRYLEDHQADEMIGAVVIMADRVDLDALKQELSARRADRREWHETVVLALQAKATASQAGIMSELAGLANQGLVADYRGAWIGNVVLVTASREALDILVQRDDVLQINPDYEIVNIEPVSKSDDDPSLIASVENGLRAIRADEVWAMGYTGAGRLVSHLDTGVDGNHPALNARWRGYDSRYADNPEWAWFDPVTNTQFPFDAGSHGTHTMGTICGLGEGTGDTIGVAFGAEWISAGVIDRVSIPRTVADAILSFEWIADPDDDPSTVWDVPDCNSNSWGVGTFHGYERCDPIFWDVLDGCEAAGVFVVFAAGNEGSGPRTLRNPATRATTDIQSFAIGALNGNDPNLPIASFSSRGPTECTPDGSDTIKPEVSAPGVNVRSSVPGGGYAGGWSGTSMACPHVAGVVALMREANPNLTTDQIGEIMLETAADLGQEGEDNAYGMGIVDAYEAVTMALAFLEGWGTLAGYITDQASGDPIQGATVSVIDRPWSATSNGIGYYRIFMPADTLYDIRVDNSPTHLPVFDQLMVAENETLWVDYALEGKVTVTLRASFANPEDASYRAFYLKGSWDNDGFYDASWSGDYIAVYDDGAAPDETAEDGVYTGTVMLARDQANTYSWAIYSETYGGEDARLDDGADFDIPDLNPPDVATLVVDPSGSDNNWVISVEGDNGLSIDLMQGIDNTPTKWGAAVALDEGITYTFLFHVMHSDIASYGSGGIGGADLTYTPTVDGSYDFIFNDSDDSYIVQLTGTEGPPTYLSTISGLDHHIPVSWLPPGTVESQEMAYDDGVLANGYYYFAYDALMATMFVPESHPVSIDSVKVHVLTEGDPFWPWPDGTHDPVGVSIFLDNGSGFPENDPVFYEEVVCTPGEWIRIDVDEIVVTQGNFWVAMNNLAGGGEDGMGLDANTDFLANKWARVDGVWGMQNIYNGDHMIRAMVFGGGRLAWMGHDSSPAEEVAADVPVFTDPAGTAGLISANGSEGTTDRMAYYPMVSPVEPPMTLDIQVLAGYNLYRDTSPAPYDRGLQINAELITETSYDDWGDDPYGPIINGITYFYQGSAVYDIGGGEFVEVGPSNEATGMAINHPPATPLLNEPEVLGFEVSLSWSFEDPIGDFDHFIIYRKLMPFGEWGIIGTSVVESFVDVIPDGEDGSYGYEVTAIDDGEPPLESGRSNTVYALVGHLPPSGLVAVSGEEFVIPLSWNLPGSWRAPPLPDEPDVTSLGSRASDDPWNTLPISPGILDLSHKGDNGQPGPPIILDQGGPDEFGYRWIDSDEPGGPLYSWVDITDRGQQLFMSDDDNQGPFSMDFEFSFYDEPFTSFRVCSNGWLSFTSTNGNYFNEPIPDPGVMENLIAPFWDDLNPSIGGEVWVYTNQDSAIVSWINVPHYSVGGPYTVQAILLRHGAVIFQYQDINDPDNSATIGIQNSDGSIGLQVVFDAPYVHDELAIRISTGPEGQPPDHYILYRSLSSPVPVDPANIVADDIPGEQTSYLDAGLENDVTYYYVLTAVWQDEVESPPSNEANATPENHPPSNPTNLTGYSIIDTVYLSWFPNPEVDIAQYRVYRRDYNEPDFNLVGTVDHPDTAYEEIVTVDGIYRYKIAAVDDDGVQSEGFSNHVDVAVGAIPPRQLTATTDLEFQIRCDWRHPGGRPLIPNMTVLVIAADNATIFLGELAGFDDVDQADYFDARNGTPSLEQLSDYDMVVVWSNYQFSDPVGMGNVLADYADEGGGVVIQQFSFGAGWNMQGRLMDEYSPFNAGPIQYTNHDMGDYDPAHPIMDDVGPINGYYMSSISIVNDGEWVASWDDGTPFVAYNPEVNVVAVNGYIGDSRQFTGDMIILVHNAMNYALGGAEIIPDNYRLYKSDDPSGPFNVLVELPGDVRTYMDTPVPNDFDYYYFVTALYEGPEESDPSNIALGRGMNYPPNPPEDLAAVVDDRDVNLTWTFDDFMGDLDHFNIYKKIVPGGEFELDGSSLETSYVMTIPDGEDGTYAVVVTAVDDGDPELESDYSNQTFAPVGNLPPINLRATSDQDGVVPLEWNEPGLRPTTTIIYDDGVLANGYYYFAYENIMANRFVGSSPVEVETLWVHVLTEGDPFWPWPDGNHDPVGISLWDDNGSGMPGDQVYYTEVVCVLGEWIMVPIEGGISLDGPNFWIGLQNLAGGGEDGMGIDSFTDFPEHKWALVDGLWGTQDIYAGDHMIRATIIDSGRRLLLNENAPTVELALQAETGKIAGSAALPQVVLGAADVKSDAVPLMVSGAKTAPLALVSGAGISETLDILTLLGYNVYRSETAGVPTDPEHLVNDEYVTDTAYDDTSVVNGTTYYYVVTAVYDNEGEIEESPPSNEVDATPLMGAMMVLDPTSFTVSGDPGEIVTENLNIANPGGLDLSFTIVAETDDRRRSNPGESTPDWTFEAKFTSHSDEFDKSEAPEEETNPPVILDRGGPDEFGYIWIDSDEPGGPTFDWIDITGIGDSIFMTDDDNQGPFQMAFNFPFYGSFFNSIRLCSNGFLSFTSTSTDWSNDPIPGSSAPENLIAPFWEDIAPHNGGMIYFYTDESMTVFSWIDVPAFDWGGGTGPFTFEVILYPSGAIKYQYLQMYPPLASATIGIQDGTRTIGLQIAFDQPYVHDDLAVMITTGWLSADPTVGTVGAGDDMDVDIIFDASFVDEGTHTGQLIVTGYDVNHMVDQIIVPCTFIVTQTAVDGEEIDLPTEFALSQNYPNPFNPATEIKFSLPENTHVKIEIFNVLGQKVRTLVDSDMDAGYQSVVWNGTGGSGQSVSTGVYLYRMQAGDKMFTKKMLMLK